MRIYWRVHIKNFDIFIEYIMKNYGHFINDELGHFKDYYFDEDYLYLLIDNDDGFFNFSFCDEEEGIDWLSKNGYNYMGEYNGRREKLERLEVVSNSYGINN